MNNFSNLVTAILAKNLDNFEQKSLLIAVSGIDGSGKGYVTKKLVDALNQQKVHAVSINLDPWHKLPSQRFKSEESVKNFYEQAFNFEDLFEQLILPLQKQRKINLTTVLTGILGIPETYNYQFTDVDVIILEGIFLFKRTAKRIPSGSLQYYYDLKIWIECSWETALARAIERNQEGISQAQLIQDYQNLYFPAQRLHWQLDNPQANADLIYVNES